MRKATRGRSKFVSIATALLMLVPMFGTAVSAQESLATERRSGPQRHRRHRLRRRQRLDLRRRHREARRRRHNPWLQPARQHQVLPRRSRHTRADGSLPVQGADTL